MAKDVWQDDFSVKKKPIMGPTFAAHQALIWAPHVIAGWETDQIIAKKGFWFISL